MINSKQCLEGVDHQRGHICSHQAQGLSVVEDECNTDKALQLAHHCVVSGTAETLGLLAKAVSPSYLFLSSAVGPTEVQGLGMAC